MSNDTPTTPTSGLHEPTCFRHSDTPETDAVAYVAIHGIGSLIDVVDLDFAEELERSRDEARQLCRDLWGLVVTLSCGTEMNAKIMESLPHWIQTENATAPATADNNQPINNQ